MPSFFKYFVWLILANQRAVVMYILILLFPRLVSLKLHQYLSRFRNCLRHCISTPSSGLEGVDIWELYDLGPISNPKSSSGDNLTLLFIEILVSPVTLDSLLSSD
jgi:hypothetical protein